MFRECIPLFFVSMNIGSPIFAYWQQPADRLILVEIRENSPKLFTEFYLSICQNLSIPLLCLGLGFEFIWVVVSDIF